MDLILTFWYVQIFITLCFIVVGLLLRNLIDEVLTERVSNGKYTKQRATQIREVVSKIQTALPAIVIVGLLPIIGSILYAVIFLVYVHHQLDSLFKLK